MRTRTAQAREGSGEMMKDGGAELPGEGEALRLLREQTDLRMHEFVARLAHELRTPLGAILMWAHVLRTGSDADRTTALNAIDASARAQSKMIGHLLDVSRALAGRLRIDLSPLDLRDPFRSAADVGAGLARERAITFVVETGTGSFSIEGDSQRIHDSIASLVDNAIKFTADGGAVALELVQVGDEARVVVRDNGRGLAPEDLRDVFTPFRLLGDAKIRPMGGLGVSLALVRLVAELHGGTAIARSEGVGRGAEFTLVLPLAHAAG
ncbi:MAG: HAMP domain-containing sensor histidine kinase [Haliangium ochraceum]